MSQLFTLGGQSIGASASVLPTQFAPNKGGPEEAETGGQVMAGVLERKMGMPRQSSLTPETREGFQGCVLRTQLRTAKNGQQIGYGSQDEVYKEFIRRGPYARPAWDSPGNSSCPASQMHRVHCHSQKCPTLGH